MIQSCKVAVFWQKCKPSHQVRLLLTIEARSQGDKKGRVEVGGEGLEENDPLTELNKLILPKTENMSFLMLCFKLQA